MPNETLTLEQCKNLRDWGLPQELEEGDMWWFGTINGSLYEKRWNGENRDRRLYKIPYFDVLLEFAATLTVDWNIYPNSPGWVVAIHDGIGVEVIREDAAIQAVYKLIAKHFEVKREA